MTGRGIARIVVVACAAALLALPAAPAGGAEPLTFGLGRHPDVAVDGNGTAHVVWDEQHAAGQDPLHYCQVPRGGQACTQQKKLEPPRESVGRAAYVFAPGGGRILLVSLRCCDADEHVLVYESTDGGQTFAGPRDVGSLDFSQQAVFGPGDSISGVDRTDFQNVNPAGPRTTAFADLEPGFSVPTFASVGIHNGTTPVVVRSDGANTTFHRYDGDGSLNDKANWVGPTPTSAVDEPDLAGGPAGLVMLGRVGDPGKRRLVARTFDGSAFGGSVGVSETGDPIFAGFNAEPTQGRFHAVWVANGVTPNEIRWARSAKGETWGDPQMVLRGGDAEEAYDLRVSAGADGHGFVVWDQNSPSGYAKGMPLVPGQSGEPPTDTERAGDVEARFFAPDAACVARPSKALLYANLKRVKKVSKRARLVISTATFKLGRKDVVDRKAAFRGVFSTQGYAPGSSQKATARLVLRRRDGRGKARVLKLSGGVSICGE